MSGGTINATKCIDYLRRVGVAVDDEAAARWIETERETRERNRATSRELKKSCGHFRTSECRVTSAEWSGIHVVCSDCGRIVRELPNVPPPPRGRKQRTA